jgi:hypothetical protein
MSEFTSLFSQNEDETRLLLRSKPLIVGLLAGCYLLSIYCFGFINAIAVMPIVGVVFGKCNIPCPAVQSGK